MDFVWVPSWLVGFGPVWSGWDPSSVQPHSSWAQKRLARRFGTKAEQHYHPYPNTAAIQELNDFRKESKAFRHQTKTSGQCKANEKCTKCIKMWCHFQVEHVWFKASWNCMTTESLKLVPSTRSAHRQLVIMPPCLCKCQTRFHARLCLSVPEEWTCSLGWTSGW